MYERIAEYSPSSEPSEVPSDVPLPSVEVESSHERGSLYLLDCLHMLLRPSAPWPVLGHPTHIAPVMEPWGSRLQTTCMERRVASSGALPLSEGPQRLHSRLGVSICHCPLRLVMRPIAITGRSAATTNSCTKRRPTALDAGQTEIASAPRFHSTMQPWTSTATTVKGISFTRFSSSCERRRASGDSVSTLVGRLPTPNRPATSPSSHLVAISMETQCDLPCVTMWKQTVEELLSPLRMGSTASSASVSSMKVLKTSEM
mmetsp:Transcript_28948/g.63301  ORF Transcript_28948/g.63301 Transcript_28948/m.63301 type:complete len:259 (-) Transcript_28948:463-1239(-)